MGITLYTGTIVRQAVNVAVGTTELVAAIPLMAVVVLGGELRADDTQGGSTFTLNTGSGAVIAGPFPLPANGVCRLPVHGIGYANTVIGEALNIIVTAGAISGVLTLQGVKDAN